MFSKFEITNSNIVMHTRQLIKEVGHNVSYDRLLTTVDPEVVHVVVLISQHLNLDAIEVWLARDENM